MKLGMNVKSLTECINEMEINEAYNKKILLDKGVSIKILPIKKGRYEVNIHFKQNNQQYFGNFNSNQLIKILDGITMLDWSQDQDTIGDALEGLGLDN